MYYLSINLFYLRLSLFFIGLHSVKKISKTEERKLLKVVALLVVKEDTKNLIAQLGKISLEDLNIKENSRLQEADHPLFKIDLFKEKFDVKDLDLVHIQDLYQDPLHSKEMVDVNNTDVNEDTQVATDQ